MTTSEDNMTVTWDFLGGTNTTDKYDLKGLTDNGIIFEGSKDNVIRHYIKGYVSHKPYAGMYIPVKQGVKGSINFLDTNSKTDRYTELTINGTGTGYYIYPKKSDEGGSSLNFTPSDVTVIDGVSYLHFVNVAGEMKTTFITLTMEELGETTSKFNVIFNHNYEGSSNHVVQTDDYGMVDDSYVPLREGYDFLGWYEDENLTVPFDFTSQINEDKTLYASWKEIIVINGTGKINGDLSSLSGLVLTLKDEEQGITYTHTINSEIYDFGEVRDGNYKLSINDTTGLITIDNTNIVIDESSDVLGDITIVVNEKMNKDYTWDITKGLVKGYNGNGLIALEDMPYKQEEQYAQGSNNPKLDDDVDIPITGAALKLMVEKDGEFNAVLSIGKGKTNKVVDSTGSEVASYKNEGEESIDYTFNFKVDANQTYYIYGSGTKVMIRSLSYKVIKEADLVTLNYQFNDDLNPTKVRFIGVININDVNSIDEINLYVTKNGETSIIKIYSLYTSISGLEEFSNKDNVYYVVHVFEKVENMSTYLEVKCGGDSHISATRNLAFGG